MWVRPHSTKQTGPPYGAASEQRDKEGVSMTFGNFLRKSDGTMQVDYGYYCGPLCAGSYTAILKKNASGDWEVQSVETNWVS